MKYYFSLFFFILLGTFYVGAQCPLTVSDIDGNSYPVVQVGSQCWMAENLKVNHYRDSSAIPDSLSQSQWSSTTQGAIGATSLVYGNYYNFYTVIDPGGLCPSGWHVPSDSEFVICINALGGGLVAGGAMKESGTIHWNSPNSGASNSSGLTALPGGYVTNTNLALTNVNMLCNWWSSTATQFAGGIPTQAAYIQLSNSNAFATYAFAGTRYGYSVRCISDNPATGINENRLNKPFYLSPNPCRDKLTINSAINTSATLKLYDSTGKLVYQSVLENHTSTLNIPAEISNGTYIVSFEDPNGNNIYFTRVSVIR
jgi:uncharacterized protein (TIGR02145 family)